jgi:NlpC/P60 family putative phage cell wall peptidase
MLTPVHLGRADIVALARQWLGTPYHAQASVRGVGADCIGLVRGVVREIHGVEPQAIPGYAADWAEANGEEALLAAARAHLREIDPADLAPGDIAIFRYRSRFVAKHAGFAADARSGGLSLIHAMEGVGVTEVGFGAWWRRRIAGAFSIPRSES